MLGCPDKVGCTCVLCWQGRKSAILPSQVALVSPECLEGLTFLGNKSNDVSNQMYMRHRRLVVTTSSLR